MKITLVISNLFICRSLLNIIRQFFFPFFELIFFKISSFKIYLIEYWVSLFIFVFFLLNFSLILKMTKVILCLFIYHFLLNFIWIFFFPSFGLMFFMFCSLTCIQLEIENCCFYLFSLCWIFTNFKNDLSYLEFFYLSFFIEFSLTSFLNWYIFFSDFIIQH